MKKVLRIYFLVIGVTTLSLMPVFAKDQNNECNTQTHTIMENGKIIKETVIKRCDENIQLNQKSFTEKLFTEEEYETLLIMSFIFILENVL